MNTSFSFLYKYFHKENKLKTQFYYYENKIQIPYDIKIVLLNHKINKKIPDNDFINLYGNIGIFDIKNRTLSINAIKNSKNINENDSSFIKLFQQLDTLVCFNDEQYEILKNRFGTTIIKNLIHF